MLGSIAASFMGEPQAVHCGPWFCASSMGYFSEISVRPGVPGSPASQPAALDLKGSNAMTLISTRLHLGHSNNRCSKPIGPGEMRSNIIRVRQCEQRRRSMVVKDCGDEGTMLPLYWAGALLISQSPITAYSDGWNQSCPIHQCGAGQYCSHRKVKERRGAKSLQRAFLPMKINPLSPEPLIC
jgi:hypothetical protein